MDIDTAIQYVTQSVEEHKGCDAEKKKLKEEAQIVLGTCKKLNAMLAKETKENNNTVQMMDNELKKVVNVHQVEKEKSVIRIVDLERKLASLRLENKTLQEQILVLQPKSDLKSNEKKQIKILSEANDHYKDQLSKVNETIQKFNEENDKKFKSIQDKCKCLDEENKCLKNELKCLKTEFEEYKMSHD